MLGKANRRHDDNETHTYINAYCDVDTEHSTVLVAHGTFVHTGWDWDS